MNTNSNEVEALKPCPFCQRAPHTFMGGLWRKQKWVACYGTKKGFKHEVISMPLEQWNTRTPTTTTDGNNCNSEALAGLIADTADEAFILTEDGLAGEPTGLMDDGMCDEHGTFGCKRCIIALSPSPSGDVARLVLAAREVVFGNQPPPPEVMKELDGASEAFASTIPWENENEA